MLFQTRPIQTINKVISVKGKVFYSDSRRRIDLKKPIRDLFETSTTEALYIMELCMSKQKLLQRVEELESKNVIPVLLYFMKR